MWTRFWRKATESLHLHHSAGLPSPGSRDGTGSLAQFNSPMSVAADSAGTVYVADAANHTIRKITPSGTVTTFAGTAGSCGSVDGLVPAARFCFPKGIAVDGAGTVYVADGQNQTIRKITAAGSVSTLAGPAGVASNVDGQGSLARFNTPSGIAVDSAGNVFVADMFNHTIRKITPSGAVTTFAGFAGFTGSTDGTGFNARFNFPNGLGIDGSGNLYVADQQIPLFGKSPQGRS